MIWVDRKITARLYQSSLACPSLILYRSVQLQPASSRMAESTPTGLPEGAAVKQDKPPKLSSADFRAYNRMADHMEMFVGIRPNETNNSTQQLTGQQHNSFRQTWKTLYAACSSGRRPSNTSLRQFLTVGLDFCHHLEMHHSIEENHIFPLLAKNMPEFRKELDLLTQHKQIHAGLDKFEAYLEACRRGETELRLEEAKSLMDAFGDVLWAHLEDEVKALGAENMRRFWTLQEMERMPM